MGQRADVVSMVEAAYRIDSASSEWVRTLLEHARPQLDQGLGVAGFTFRVERGALTIDDPVELGTRPGFAHQYAMTASRTPPIAIEKAYLGAPGLATYRTVFGDSPEALRMFDERIGPMLGMTDFLAFNALDPTGRGVAMVAPLKEPATPAQLGSERWLRIGAHLCAGLRLRQAIGGEPLTDLPLGGEAVLDGGGAVVDARGEATSKEALATLRDATRRADRARGKLRHDEDAALEIWEGLVDGRWSLVDFYDSDGRRFFVARKNDPETPDPRSLTMRERQVVRCAALGHPSKVIGYELGLAPSTVATHLGSAMRKLGVTSIAELVYFIRRLSPAEAVT